MKNYFWKLSINATMLKDFNFAKQVVFHFKLSGNNTADAFFACSATAWYIRP